LPHEVTLLRDIELGIVFAALAAHIARLVRQPLILGYIADIWAILFMAVQPSLADRGVLTIGSAWTM
jgi:hypothetical protein